MLARPSAPKWSGRPPRRTGFGSGASLFELETLLRVQTALADLAPAVREAHVAHVDMVKAAGSYGEAELDEATTEALGVALEALESAMGLVLDGTARTATATAYQRATDLLRYRGRIEDARQKYTSWDEERRDAQRVVAARVERFTTGR